MNVQWSSTNASQNEAEYDPAMRRSEQQEIEWLVSKINLPALTDRASFLRNGIPCTVPPLTFDRATRRRVIGSMNYHIDLRFSDGIVWIARIRRVNATPPPPQVRDNIFTSEVATLKIPEHTGVPAPRVHDFALEGPSNLVGVSYMLQEKIAGRSCSWSLANPEQKKNLLKDLANVFIELSAHPFDSMRSPVLQPSLAVGPFARESLTDIYRSSTMKTLGPFYSLRDYHTAEIHLILDLIRRREMYVQQPVDAYLIHLFLLEMVPHITKKVENAELGKSSCFLTHPDDKGDHTSSTRISTKRL
jgi:hypothetical protein